MQRARIEKTTRLKIVFKKDRHLDTLLKTKYMREWAKSIPRLEKDDRGKAIA